MSHSQFQSRIFILRRAWLNLWDERMTTDRINQVASYFPTAQHALRRLHSKHAQRTTQVVWFQVRCNRYQIVKHSIPVLNNSIPRPIWTDPDYCSTEHQLASGQSTADGLHATSNLNAQCTTASRCEQSELYHCDHHDTHRTSGWIFTAAQRVTINQHLRWMLL